MRSEDAYNIILESIQNSFWDWYRRSEIGERTGGSYRSETAEKELQTWIIQSQSRAFEEQGIAQVWDWDGMSFSGGYVTVGMLPSINGIRQWIRPSNHPILAEPKIFYSLYRVYKKEKKKGYTTCHNQSTGIIGWEQKKRNHYTIEFSSLA